MVRLGCETRVRSGVLVRLLPAALALGCASLLCIAASRAIANERGTPDRAPEVTGSVSPASEPRLAGNSSATFGPEQRAEELYLDALEKLAVGREAWAQKTFETLIARFPQSNAAALARNQLGILYRGGAHQALAPVGSEPAVAAKPVAPETVAAPIGANPFWEQELRRNAAIQARLRSEAGDRVFFSEGSAELGGRARTALAAQAQWLNRWHEFEAAVEGHADEPGNDEENIRLSAARAEAVRRLLVKEGVDPGRLVTVAQGRTQRLAVCPDAGCAAQNRRAVTLVFASGTRERLGLAGPASLQAPERPQTLSPGLTQSAGTPATDARADAAR